MGVSDRLAWAAGVLDPRPGERVLEVGSGYGVLVSLVSTRGAEVVALDRSATMTAAAARRNAAAVDAGRVRPVTASLTEAALNGRFDAVVSFNVRAFWTPPVPEWDVVERLLATGGRVVVAWSVMDGGAADPVRDAADPVHDAVRRLAGDRGLAVTAEHRAATTPYPLVALELRRG